jgi:hypothetical protein
MAGALTVDTIERGEALSVKNPNCDSVHCTQVYGEVRLLPIGGGGNAILCRECFRHERMYRRQRNQDLGVEAFELPEWETLTPYDAAWVEVRPMQACKYLVNRVVKEGGEVGTADAGG